MRIAAQDTADRRRATRRHLGDHGQIGLPDGTVTAACWIADVSQTGARISLFSSLGLPPEFWLSAESTAKPWRAKVAWQIGNQVGVQFIAEFTSPGTGPVSEAERMAGASTIVSRILKRPLLVA